MGNGLEPKIRPCLGFMFAIIIPILDNPVFLLLDVFVFPIFGLFKGIIVGQLILGLPGVRCALDPSNRPPISGESRGQRPPGSTIIG